MTACRRSLLQRFRDVSGPSRVRRRGTGRGSSRLSRSLSQSRPQLMAARANEAGLLWSLHGLHSVTHTCQALSTGRLRHRGVSTERIRA